MQPSSSQPSSLQPIHPTFRTLGLLRDFKSRQVRSQGLCPLNFVPDDFKGYHPARDIEEVGLHLEPAGALVPTISGGEDVAVALGEVGVGCWGDIWRVEVGVEVGEEGFLTLERGEGGFGGGFFAGEEGGFGGLDVGV